jgi:hypothetical protein
VPYRGGSLADLFRATTTAAPTRRLMRDVASGAGRHMTERAADLTPRKTGRTAGAWRELSVMEFAGGAEGGTENLDYRALFLEEGVKPHDVKPKRGNKAISTPDGARAHAHHPGFGGAHMLARAAAETELGLTIIATPSLHEWAPRSRPTPPATRASPGPNAQASVPDVRQARHRELLRRSPTGAHTAEPEAPQRLGGRALAGAGAQGVARALRGARLPHAD